MANTGTSGAPSNEPLTSGTVLQNRYAIERLLGGGGMGMVYLAHDHRLANRPCAVKEMVDHFIDQQQRIEANDYFAREADTLAQLKHAAIPAITDRFDDQNRHYLVMEYVEGRNLEEEIAARGGPLPEGLIIDIARQLCDVLAYLHGSTPPVTPRNFRPSAFPRYATCALRSRPTSRAQSITRSPTRPTRDPRASRISATCCSTARAWAKAAERRGSARTAAPPASRCRPTSPRRSRRRVAAVAASIARWPCWHFSGSWPAAHSAPPTSITTRNCSSASASNRSSTACPGRSRSA